jgi:hypothetical protein
MRRGVANLELWQIWSSGVSGIPSESGILVRKAIDFVKIRDPGERLAFAAVG